MTITFPSPAKQERQSLIAAVSDVLDVLAGKPGGATLRTDDLGTVGPAAVTIKGRMKE